MDIENCICVTTSGQKGGKVKNVPTNPPKTQEPERSGGRGRSGAEPGGERSAAAALGRCCRESGALLESLQCCWGCYSVAGVATALLGLLQCCCSCYSIVGVATALLGVATVLLELLQHCWGCYSIAGGLYCAVGLLQCLQRSWAATVL